MDRINVICIISGGAGGSDLLKSLYEEVEEYIPPKWKSRYKFKYGAQLRLPLYEDSEVYKYVMKKADENKLNPTIFNAVQYTKSELNKVEFFHMNVPCVTELEGTYAKDYGTKFINSCPVCGLGGELDGDALIDRKLMKNYKIGSLIPCIFVSEELKDIILENDLTGVGFVHKVKDYKGRDMKAYYVMEIENILPPMRESTWLRDDVLANNKMPECGHRNCVYLRSDMQYDSESIQNANDFNLTYEYLNNYRVREIVVSRKTKDVFKYYKIYAGFNPVYIYSTLFAI